MPRYVDAARVAAQIGVDLEKADWRGYKPQNRGLLGQYNAFLAAESGRPLVKDLDERPLSHEQSQRAWAALRLDEPTHRHTERNEASTGSSNNLNTRIRLRTVDSGSHWKKYLGSDFDSELDMGMCIFINDIVSRAGLTSSEEWSSVHHITVGLVYTHTNVEVIVAIEETVLATVLYEQVHQRLLQITGQIGVAQEILSAITWAGRLTSDNRTWQYYMVEFEDAQHVLMLTIGAAALLEFKDTFNTHGSAKVKPQCSSRWMPWSFVQRLLALLPVREGFVDLRDGGMQSAVRPVLTQHLRFLCPQCWKTGNPSLCGRADLVKPLRLLKYSEPCIDYTIVTPRSSACSSNECEKYTAVSHLWSRYKGDDTIRFFRDSAATVGGPTSLWVDTLCINQKNTQEKAMELTHMGDYYTAAHTTLIVPERVITSVPLVQLSRYLVAMPDQLRNYQGLSTWRQDRWHKRVWTFQEGYLSRNPRVVNSDMNTGLSACWLDFIAFAAEQNQPVMCEVGLPPWHRTTGREYGGYDDYVTPFLRGWAACSQHAWAPDSTLVQMPLGTLLDLTTQRRCTEEQDSIIGLLGLALSAKGFRADGIRDLDNAYREAVRCGAIGAEVLRADLGGTSPNSCWIPKKAQEANFAPSMRTLCNALQPIVEQGNLVCRAFTVIIDANDRARCTNRGTHNFSIWSSYGRLIPRRLTCHGTLSPRGDVYVLEAAENDDSSKDRILLCASVTDSGSHHIESIAIIPQRYVNNQTLIDLLRGKDSEHVTLSLGNSYIPAPPKDTEPLR
ncbi:hypothetical protein F4679DRAFT_123638 [Xylaria curta]|nr:hypothetical protein F4679DRAFT_123638 [Xylaria curta]